MVEVMAAVVKVTFRRLKRGALSVKVVARGVAEIRAKRVSVAERRKGSLAPKRKAKRGVEKPMLPPTTDCLRSKRVRLSQKLSFLLRMSRLTKVVNCASLVGKSDESIIFMV